MTILRHGLCLALLGAALAAAPTVSAAAPDQPVDHGGSVVQRLREAAEGTPRISTEPSTGRIGFVRAARGGDLMPDVPASGASGALDKADAYLDQYATAFGADAAQLHRASTTTTRLGSTITYQQDYRGVPVFGSALKVNVDRGGDLVSVNGFAAPDLHLSTTPRYTAAEAGRRSVAAVRQSPPRDATGLATLRVVQHQLVVYRIGSTHGTPGPAVLAWVVQVEGGNVHETLVVDASTGKPVNRWTSASGLAPRRSLYDGGRTASDLVWQEGDTYPGTLKSGERNLLQDAADSYWLYANTFGRDSFDGQGSRMVTVENFGDPGFCPNAQWDGRQVDMCPDSEADDVVSHEWGHAYQQYTAGLVYQWQSGALDESFSDVWGETVDLINRREDGAEGDLTTPRPVGQCSTHSPSTPVVTVNQPSTIAHDCLTGGAAFGPAPTGLGVTADVVAATDAPQAGGTSTDGCSAFTNADQVSGNIALVDESTSTQSGCSYERKATNAEAAGAVGVIVASYDDSVFTMPADPDIATEPSIVSAIIPHADGQQIRSTLAGGQGVNATIRDASGDRTTSYRWLIGEKATAFGGAIRDMWMPECYGDPGRVTDAEYKCSSSDNGGVHGNSGVPNHGYALLVDGGTYNGVTVPGIGLDKAANLWWQAEVAHLTPLSDFTDLADGLDASCNELVGHQVNRLSVTPDNPGTLTEPFTPADCQAVTAMEQAVELRTAPSQCDFRPLLAKDAPSVCGRAYSTVRVWRDGFAHGLDRWRRSGHVVSPRGHGYPWKATSDAPGGHAGPVAFAPDPIEGDCSGGPGDISSVNRITSHAITIPGGRTPRLTFQHYVDSEVGWDGGNVRLSIDGGPYLLVPKAAYAFNPPNQRLSSRATGNSDPLAGQLAFTGTDGGTNDGSWGTSIIDLAKAGVAKGDHLRIQLSFGRDGCNGVRGWYVDNVVVAVCQRVLVRREG